MLKKTNLKNYYVEEELDGVDVDGIRNLEGLPSLLFIGKEYGNLNLVADGGELTRNIKKKKKLEVLLEYKMS